MIKCRLKRLFPEPLAKAPSKAELLKSRPCKLRNVRILVFSQYLQHIRRRVRIPGDSFSHVFTVVFRQFAKYLDRRTGVIA